MSDLGTIAKGTAIDNYDNKREFEILFLDPFAFY